MEHNEQNPSVFSSESMAYFSVYSIMFSALLICFFMYRASNEFVSHDPMPELIPLTPETAAQMGQPAEVKVGLYVKDFAEFNIVDNRFEFSGILWFYFDPSIISLATLGKFSFEKGKIVSISEPSTRIVKGKLLARYDIRVNFKANPMFEAFPFDSHTLYITLDNNHVSPGELILDSTFDELVLSPELSFAGWKIYGTRVYPGYSVARIDKSNRAYDVAHPRIIFALDFVHSGVRQAILIIFPLLLLFFMAMFTFALDLKNYKTSIASLSAGAITGILAYRFVIDRLAPQVGYFMESDSLFFLFLFAVCIAFFINVGIPVIRDSYTKLIVLLLHAFVLLSFIWIIRG
jgi:hypothetical protein